MQPNVAYAERPGERYGTNDTAGQYQVIDSFLRAHHLGVEMEVASCTRHSPLSCSACPSSLTSLCLPDYRHDQSENPGQRWK